MSAAEKPRDWTARRIGPIYCAPACGGRCTFADFRKATAKGEALAKNLGPGWSPVVHENLGWHFRAETDEAAVYESRDGTYWASVFAGGKQIIGEASTPRKAIAEAIETIELQAIALRRRSAKLLVATGALR